MKLHDYMTEKKLTYRQMAALLGVDAAQVHRWCSGARVPSILMAQTIRDATKGAVTADDFVDQPAKTEAA